MPTFRTAPSGNLTDSIRRLVASGGSQLSPLQEMQADTMAADLAHKNSLVEKVRQEVEKSRFEIQAERDKAAAAERAMRLRADPGRRLEIAADYSGVALPDASQLLRRRAGEMDPNPQGAADAADNAYGNVPVMLPKGVTPMAEAAFRHVYGSLLNDEFGKDASDPVKIAQAAENLQGQSIARRVQDYIDRGDYQGASAINQGGRLGTAIKLHENIGNTGATFAPATGAVASDPKAQPANTLLARTIAGSEAQAERDRAAADASRAQADRARREPTDAQRPPAGYRWKADGTLEKIPGGPADDKATSSDAERIAAGYAARMEAAARILGDLEKKGVGKPGFVESAARASGAETAANLSTMSDPERQKYRQAQEDWVRAKLRKESGAVIANDEMEREIRVYFPQIGDSAAVLKQKRDARKVAEQAMKQSGGRAVKPDAAPNAPAGEVQARKRIGNVEFVKINGEWFQP